MTQFICTAPEHTATNIYGEVFGTEQKRALFHASGLRRTRYYRNPINNPQPGLRLLVYKTRKRAQEVCDIVNEYFNDNFEVEQLNKESNE